MKLSSLRVRSKTGACWKAMALVCALILSACGSRGSSATNSSVGAPTSLSYSLNPAHYPLSTTITANTITSDKQVASFSISPTLPSGLQFDTQSGAITGTTTATVSQATSYMVTATNSYGSDFTTLTLGVGDVPEISYPSGGALDFSEGVSVGVVSPTLASGTISSCAISPALPSGLALNSSTCEITGTPSAAQTATAYTVTPSNGAGSSDADITITVQSNPPDIAYPSGGALSFIQGVSVGTVTPTVTNGPITDCTVSPGLPSGLSLSSSTCAITGTPTGSQGSTPYTVTVSGAYGSAPASISIAVQDLPPSIGFSPNSYVYTLNSAISTIVPSNSGGTISSCAISPNLGANTGLTFSTTDCEISGTPTTLSTSTNYTVTPSGPGGSGSGVTVTITVDDRAPGISYSPSSKTYFDEIAISTLSPSNTGGAITSCAISPSGLPSGLAFNTTNCQITGTPTATFATTSYTVTATNSGGSSNATVAITVNESPPNPAFPTSPFTFTKNSPITPVTPTDTGGGPITSCSAVPSLPAGISLSSSCQILGTPTATAATNTYTITGSNSAGNGSATISITVQDAAPAFSYPASPYTFTKGTAISTIVPTSTGGTITSCSVSPGLPTGLTLNTTNCSISGTPTAIDAGANYTVTGTNSAGSSNATINITVDDVAPVISYPLGPYNFTLSTSIGTINPTNTGSTITGCSVSPSLPSGVSFSTTTCAMTGTPSATSASASYTITASNSGGTSVASVTIEVTSSAPSISYAASPYTFTNGSATGLPVSVTNSGGTIGSCAVSPSLPAGLSISGTTCQISGTPTAVSASTVYTVTATNSGGSANTNVTIQVTDALPVISYSGSPFSFGINSAITAQNITNTGGVISSCSASPTLPAGLSISSACQITGTPTVQQSATSYTVSATNTAGTATTSISIAVIKVPNITYPGSPYTFTKGTAISTITPSNSGSPATTCSSGTWGPSGLTLNSDCSITGTPTALQTQTTYTIANSNSNGSGSSATVAITVVDNPPTISYSPTTDTFSKGVAITSVTPTLGGGAVTSCSISPSLSANTGLTFNTSTCVISGTPTSASSSQAYTITASNTGGSATASLLIGVNDSLPALSYSGSPYAFNAGSAITEVSPSNSGGAISSCSSSPALPAGLSLDTSCDITGTPTTGQNATNYTISATNTGGTSTANLSIAVNTVPSISYPSSPYTFTKGSAITSFSPTNSGFGAITSCTISPNLTSNTGLTFSTTICQISGTPTAIESATSYTVTPTSSAGAGSAATVNITVNDAAPTISYSPTTYTFSNGVAITSVTPTLGGGAVTSCSISPSLSSNTGLSFNTSTCVISGTPNAYSATQAYTVTATNSGGTASQNLSIAVNDTLPALTYADSPYSWVINSSVGTITPGNTGGAVTSCSVSPALPAGLSLSTACVITGTPTVAQVTANYTITATNTGGSANTNISIAVVTVPSLSYAGPYTFGQDVGITTLTPTNSGSAATSCSSSPDLNAATGLTLNADCSIAGTPTTAAAAADYSITGTNSAGSSTAAVVNIAVVAAPSISYSPSSDVFTLRTTISAVGVTNSGGTISSCSSSPTLPGGLTLSSACDITGTPTSISSATNYTITATNAAGTSSATLNLRVKDQLEILFYGFMNTDGVWNDGAMNSQNVWKVTQDGQGLIALTQNGGTSADEYDSLFPSFMGTGDTVVFVSLTALSGAWNGSAATSYNIWNVSSGGGTLSDLAPTNASSVTLQSPPVYSPDGTMIAFTSMQNVSGTAASSYNIWVMNADGSSQTALTQITTRAGVDCLNPAWSPDSSTIYFQSKLNSGASTSNWNGTANKSYNIWSITANGSTLNRITNETSGATERDCTNPAVSPDGSTITYASTSRIACTSGTTPSSPNIFYISSSASASCGTALTQNTSANIASANPQFSADGNTLVFQSLMDPAAPGQWNMTASSSNNVWTITAWSSSPSFTALTSNTSSGLDSITPSFAPDDSKIVFGSKMNVGGTSSSSYNIWIMNTDGTTQANVTANTGSGRDSYLAPTNVMYIAP